MKREKIEITLNKETEIEFKKIIRRSKIHRAIFIICYFLISYVLSFSLRKLGAECNEEFIFGEIYLVSCGVTYYLLSKLNLYILKSNLDRLLNEVR